MTAVGSESDEPLGQLFELPVRPSDAADAAGDSDAVAAELRGLLGLAGTSGGSGEPSAGYDEPADGPDDELLRRLGEALPQPPMVLRVIVFALALAQLALVLPWLLDADPFGLLGQSSPAHLSRDGSLGLAVAVAALLASWRPRWALPCFVLGSVALVAQAVAGLFDASVTVAGGNELVHVPSVVLVCLTGLCSIRLGDLVPRRR